MRSPLTSPVLQCLMEVAYAGSIRRAAEKLYMSPSAVNRQILNLEERLGTALFERTARGVRLTPAGEVVLNAAKESARALDQALSKLGDFRSLGGGRVAFGALSGFSESFVAPLLAHMRGKYPQLSLSYYAGNSSEIIQKVLQGELDMGLCWDPPASTPVHRIVSVDVPVGVAVLPEHPLASHSGVRLRDCLEHPVVFPSTGLEFRKVLDRINTGIGNCVAPVLEVNSIFALKQLAVSGPDAVLMTANTLLDEVEAGRVILRPLSDPDCGHLVLTLFRSDNSRSSPPLDELTQALANQVSQQGRRIRRLFYQSSRSQA